MTNIVGLDVHFGDGPCDDPSCCPQEHTEVNWELFVCYMLDNHEGEILAEENLQRWLSNFIYSDYNKKEKTE